MKFFEVSHSDVAITLSVYTITETDVTFYVSYVCYNFNSSLFTSEKREKAIVVKRNYELPSTLFMLSSGKKYLPCYFSPSMSVLNIRGKKGTF